MDSAKSVIVLIVSHFGFVEYLDIKFIDLVEKVFDPVFIFTAV